MSIKEITPKNKWVAISPSTNKIEPAPAALFCTAAGSITAEDIDGTTMTFDAAVGLVSGIRPTKVTAAAGTFYALYEK